MKNAVGGTDTLHGLEPWAYLRDVLSLIAGWPAKRALELSPRYWAATAETPEVRRLLDADPVRALSSPPDRSGHTSPRSHVIG